MFFSKMENEKEGYKGLHDLVMIVECIDAVLSRVKSSFLSFPSPFYVIHNFEIHLLIDFKR